MANRLLAVFPLGVVFFRGFVQFRTDAVVTGHDAGLVTEHEVYPLVLAVRGLQVEVGLVAGNQVFDEFVHLADDKLEFVFTIVTTDKGAASGDDRLKKAPGLGRPVVKGSGFGLRFVIYHAQSLPRRCLNAIAK